MNFFYKFKIKNLVFVLVLFPVFSTVSVAEEYQLVLPVDSLQNNMELIGSIKKKFPSLDYLDISITRQETALHVGPFESESLAQALAAEFSEQGFHPDVTSTSQINEARPQSRNVSGSEPEVSAPGTSQVVQESTVVVEEPSGLEASPSQKMTGGDGPLDALAVQDAGALTSSVPGNESDVNAPAKSKGIQESTVTGEETLRLEPPSPQQEAGDDEPLDALDLEDLDAPASDVEVAGQDGAFADVSFADVLADENYLLLKLSLDDVVLAEDLVGYASGGTTYLPLAAFFRSVGFPISINSDFSTVTGWFVDKQRTFVLDREKKIVAIEGKELALGEFDVVDNGYALYASNHALAKWFPLQVAVSPNFLTAKIMPTEQLPIQKLFGKNKAERNRDGQRVSNTLRSMDYALFEPSAMKITTTGKYTKQKSKEAKIDDSVIVEYSGDLAYFNTNVYATGNLDGKEDHLKSLRFIAKRIDPENEMLGPLKASEIHLGDVNTVNFIGTGTGGSQQKGIYITNRPLTRESRYDTTTISGNSLPEWDIELYQNDRLIDSQKVGDDGEYEFNDVELFYGRNIFIIKKFGPHGEQEQQEENINVTRSNLPAGDLRYQLSMGQQLSKTIELTNTGSSSKDAGNISGAIKTDIGISPFSFLTLGVESETIDNIRHNYAHLGATHSFTDYANLHFEGQADTNGGQMAQSVLQMGFSPFSLSLSHEEHFDEFEFPVIRKSSASIAPNIPLPWEDASLSASFSGTSTETEDSTSTALGNVSTLKLFKTIDLSNQLSAALSEGDYSLKSMTGKASLRALYPNDNNTLVGRIDLYGAVDYDIKSKTHVNGYEFNFFDKWRLSDNVSTFIQYAHERENNTSSTTNTYGAGFFVKMGELSITPSITYSDSGILTTGAQFSLPLAINPRNLSPQYEDRNPTTSGGVSALVFLDKNYNYIFDGEDEPLENIAVNALQVKRKELTDSSGMALIHGLPVNLPVDIDIESGKDWSSLWVVRSKGEAVYPRPGKTYLLDFPVQIVSEFDGLVMAVEGGDAQPYPSVPLELVGSDGEVVAETTSEHDGFYLFERVIPGKYFIRPRYDFLESRGLFAVPTESVKATVKGVYVSYLNVYMSENKRDLIIYQPEKFTGFSEELSVARRFSSYEEAKEAGGMLSNVQPSGNDAVMLPEVEPSENQIPQVFVHVESYRNLKLAEKAIASLYKNYSILSGYEVIALRNNVVGKGVYYRVVVAAPTLKDARKLAAHFKSIGKYANVVDM